MNFIGIKSICDHCSTFFQSCSALYRHIKSGCNALGRSSLAETSLEPLSPRLIFCSAAKLSASGSSLAFTGYSYATILITFDFAILPAIINLNTLVCLDTGCKVNLVDKA